ncbi:MAG: hypothetical protein M3328_03250 [Chloroflexota bacterium]|nr:hypothetical protein [Chloroflexota bacterium]
MSDIKWTLLDSTQKAAGAEANPISAPAGFEIIPKGSYLSPSATQRDGAGFRFLAYIRDDGWTAIPWVLKRTPGGSTAANWPIQLPLPNLNPDTGQVDPNGDECKADGLSIVLDGDTGDLWIYITSHTVPPQNSTDPNVAIAWWEGVLTGVGAPIQSGGYVPGPEPCGPQNLPYFRPNAPMTRGECAELVVRSTWPGKTYTGPQKFQDIAPGAPFFQETAILSEEGIVGGYQCTP